MGICPQFIHIFTPVFDFYAQDKIPQQTHFIVSLVLFINRRATGGSRKDFLCN